MITFTPERFMSAICYHLRDIWGDKIDPGNVQQITAALTSRKFMLKVSEDQWRCMNDDDRIIWLSTETPLLNCHYADNQITFSLRKGQ